MARLRLFCAACTCIFLLGQPGALASILTFDDHPDVTQGTFGPLGNYQGYDFNCIDCGLDRLDWIDTVGTASWNFGAVSGEFVMVNNYGGTGVIRADTGSVFSFDGLHSRVWSTAPDRPASIRGYLNDVEVWSSTITLTQDWTFYSGVSGAIDELRLELGSAFLVDDLALSSPTEIPVPAAFWLMASGLLGFLVRVPYPHANRR